MNAWPDIIGWCADCDRQFLHDTIVANRYTSAVEVGIYAGRMTVALAAAMRKTGGVVYSVDPWQEMQDGPEVARLFLATMTAHELQDVVRVYAETSADFSRRLAGRVGLAWIDGGHRYADVTIDLECWYPRADALYGHDWHLADVRRAAEDYAARVGLVAGRVPGTDNIWTIAAANRAPSGESQCPESNTVQMEKAAPPDKPEFSWPSVRE